MKRRKIRRIETLKMIEKEIKYQIKIFKQLDNDYYKKYGEYSNVFRGFIGGYKRSIKIIQDHYVIKSDDPRLESNTEGLTMISLEKNDKI